MLNVLVTGGEGLLAHALSLQGAGEFRWTLLNRREMDITDLANVQDQLNRHQPDALVNTAAYNLVEKCEEERELSWKVNATGPAVLATACKARGIPLVHYGTDYVFDGNKAAPYDEQDQPNPLNHYGKGKLAGEQAVLASSPRNLVLRTSWLFGSHPSQSKSFVDTILKLAAAQSEIRAVADQISCPTYAGDLAGWTAGLLRGQAAGLFHAVNDEAVSRLEWTRAIVEEALEAGLISTSPQIVSVNSNYFPSRMKRPVYSAMCNGKLARTLGGSLGSWRAGLQAVIAKRLIR